MVMDQTGDQKVDSDPEHCPLSSNRRHYHIDDCLGDNTEDYYNYHYVNYICMRIMEFLQFQFNLIFVFLCFVFL